MSGVLVVTPLGPDADALCATLKERAFEVHLAGNGAAAVDLALRRQPEVILMDPSLSAMDRWHAVKRLNTEPGTSRIPVLTLVSDASSPAGLQRMLAKIERTLGHLPTTRDRSSGPTARRSDPPPPSPSASPAPSVRATGGGAPAVSVVVPGGGSTPAYTPPREARPRAGRILVVDDNAMNRDMLSRRLERKGYEIEVAESGEQALELIARRRIDLVVLDWMMPGMSGLDVLKKIRERFAPIELPVVMATARSEAEDLVEALKAEANDYVTKPLNFEVVHARIRTQLGLVEAHRDLLASERRFRALLENTGDLVVQFRQGGQVLYVSPACRTLLGYEPELLKQRSFYEWLHPIDRRALEDQQRRQPTLPPAYTFLARMQRQDQSWIWVETSCRLLREEGSVLVQAACRDVTEHMERLAGDEPPLPLGGDIIAHPGWRGAAGTSKSPATERGQPLPLEEPPVVVVTVVGGGGSATDALSRRLSAAVQRVLDEERDV